MVAQHAMPGMDREAAGTIAALFLDDQDEAVSEAVSSGHENGPPDDLRRAVFPGSGDSVLAQDIGNPCLGSSETVCRDIGNSGCW